MSDWFDNVVSVFDYIQVVPVVGYGGYLGSWRLHRLVGVVVDVGRGGNDAYQAQTSYRV